VAPAPDENRQDVSRGIPTNSGGASGNALNRQSTIDNRQSSHACCALYHARILPVAIRHLNGSRRSLQRLLADVRACTIDPDPGQTAALVNVNTPRDLDRLRMRGTP